MFARVAGAALRMFVGATALLCVVGSASLAQQLTPQQFQADPGQVLSGNPDGGAQLTALIRQLALADPKDLPPIIDLLKTANPKQAGAIGAGLGQAALASVRTNQPYATEIQQSLAGANNQDASNAYATVTGNTQIGAVGGGAPGSGGGVGGPTNPLGPSPANSTLGPIGDWRVPTPPFALTAGLNTANGVFGNTPNNGNGINGSRSPP
jgi:hypothetical protein